MKKRRRSSHYDQESKAVKNLINLEYEFNHDFDKMDSYEK